MSNTAVLDAIRETHPYESVETVTHTVPTTVEIEVPVAISEEAIFAALQAWFSQPDVQIARGGAAGGCAFRVDHTGADKRRCAVGVFIPDAVYDRVNSEGTDPEGFGPETWVQEPELAYLQPHTKLLKALQNLHDTTLDEEGPQHLVTKLVGFRQGRESMLMSEEFHSPKLPEEPAKPVVDTSMFAPDPDPDSGDLPF